MATARNRLASSGAVPATVTSVPSGVTEAQSCPAAPSASATAPALDRSSRCVAAIASCQAPTPVAAKAAPAKRMARSRMASPPQVPPRPTARV